MFQKPFYKKAACGVKAGISKNYILDLIQTETELKPHKRVAEQPIQNLSFPDKGAKKGRIRPENV